jgi:hypothetical protein
VEQYSALAKITVYGRTIEWTQELSQALGYHQYYRELGNRDDITATMGRW